MKRIGLALIGLALSLSLHSFAALPVLHAHDDSNNVNEGDLVEIAETRPMSRTKFWTVKRVIEAAVAVANSEGEASNRLGVTAPQRVAGSKQKPGHAIGHGSA